MFGTSSAEEVAGWWIWDFLFNPLTLGICGITVALVLVLDSWQKTYYRRQGIAGPRPIPILGNMLDFLEGYGENMCKMREQYGKVFGISFLGSNSLVVGDLDMLQEILISKFSSFPNHRAMPVKEKPMDSSVNNLRGADWKEARNILTPAFSGKKLKQMTSIINECCNQLLEHVGEFQGEVLQFKSLFGSYSMDVIASTFFGLKVDSHKNPNDPFVRHAKKCFDASLSSVRLLAIFMLPFLGPLFDFLDIGIFAKDVKVFFHSVTGKVIQSRQSGTEERMDMLQLMLNAHKVGESEEGATDGSLKTGKKPLTTEAIMANSMMFFLAGYETTNSALCFTSYLLASHSDHQETLIKEVDKYCPTPEDVRYEILSEMEFLDAFVHESLRMYPPVAFADRSCDATTTVNDYELKKGSGVIIPIYSIHHDPDIWQDPEEFKPERFFKESKRDIHPAAWVPFGAGPRNCLGLKLAMLEIKFGLIRMLQKYRFEICPETEAPPVLGKKTNFLCPPNGVKLRVKPRLS